MNYIMIPLDQHIMEIKREKLSKYQLMIVDFYKFIFAMLGNVKNVKQFKEKYVLHFCIIFSFLHKTRIKTKKKSKKVLEFDQSRWIKPYDEFKKQKAKQDKDEEKIKKEEKVSTNMEKRCTY